MNAVDILKYGHAFIEEKVTGLPPDAWDAAKIVGYWTVKDVIAHLASFEQMLIDVFNALQGETETRTLDRFRADPLQFNDEEVERRRHLAVDEIWAEYEAAYQKTVILMESIPAPTRHQKGTLSWYGSEYSLDDFIVYTFYGHKREHGAQIDRYRERLASESEANFMVEGSD